MAAERIEAAARDRTAFADAMKVEHDRDASALAVIERAHAALETIGCHKHRGEWRRSKDMNMLTKNPTPAGVKRRRGPIVQANPTATPAVAAAAPARPAPPWEPFDSALALVGVKRTVETLLSRRDFETPAAYDDAVTRLIVDVRKQARDLAGANPSPIERTLAETAGVAWLHLQVAQMHAAPPESTPTFSSVKHREDRYDKAVARYLKIVRTLATIRRLEVTFLLAVGANQINLVNGEAKP